LAFAPGGADVHFCIFPLVGLLFQVVVPWLWPSEPEPIRNGFLYLCVLPSTISTSVVLTAVARGNTAAALFNAALSNILGVIRTPVLVELLMRKTGQSSSIGPLLLKIMMLTLTLQRRFERFPFFEFFHAAFTMGFVGLVVASCVVPQQY